MSRRRFIMAAGLLVLPVVPARGQQRKVIGYLANNPDPKAIPTYRAFIQGLNQLGWIEGKNFEIRIRSSENDDSRFPALAGELVRQNVDVIVTTGAGSTRAAQAATKTIPVVFGSTANPVELGFVKSLAHPDGNVTGMAFFSLELGPKRLQLLKEILPQAKRFARFYSAGNQHMSPEVAQEPAAAARALNVVLEHVALRSSADFEPAFKSAVQKQVDAVAIEADAVFVNPADRAHLARLALQHRLPMIGPDRRYATSGALITYGENFEAMYQRAAYFVHRILNGAKPSELPVEQPTVVETAVNLKTAQALGITIPETILVTAEHIVK